METTLGPGLAIRVGVRTFLRIVGPLAAALGGLAAVVGLDALLLAALPLGLPGGAALMALLGGAVAFALGAGMTRAAAALPTLDATTCQHCGQPAN